MRPLDYVSIAGMARQGSKQKWPRLLVYPKANNCSFNRIHFDKGHYDYLVLSITFSIYVTPSIPITMLCPHVPFQLVVKLDKDQTSAARRAAALGATWDARSRPNYIT